jgi:hypothetical protein
MTKPRLTFLHEPVPTNLGFFSISAISPCLGTYMYLYVFRCRVTPSTLSISPSKYQSTSKYQEIPALRVLRRTKWSAYLPTCTCTYMYTSPATGSIGKLTVRIQLCKPPASHGVHQQARCSSATHFLQSMA